MRAISALGFATSALRSQAQSSRLERASERAQTGSGLSKTPVSAAARLHRFGSFRRAQINRRRSRASSLARNTIDSPRESIVVPKEKAFSLRARKLSSLLAGKRHTAKTQSTSDLVRNTKSNGPIALLCASARILPEQCDERASGPIVLAWLEHFRFATRNSLFYRLR